MTFCNIKIAINKTIDINMNILLISNNDNLCNIYIKDQKYFPKIQDNWIENKDLPIFIETKNKISDFLNGKIEKMDIKYDLLGTDFQKKVWEEIAKIPYGQTTNYQKIAQNINCNSSRAVANAISRNPLIFLIPCHRIIGKNGNLTGFAAGLDLKDKLLKLEKANINRY